MEPELTRSLLADNLRSYRRAAKLSQNQLANKAGMSAAYVSGLEGLHFDASGAGILRLAHALEVNPMLLFAPTIKSFSADRAYEQLPQPNHAQHARFVAENRAAFQPGDSAIMLHTGKGIEIHLLNR